MDFACTEGETFQGIRMTRKDCGEGSGDYRQTTGHGCAGRLVGECSNLAEFPTFE